MNKIAIYPGTFDPITNGHIDLIKRSLKIFDKVIIAIALGQKKKPLFTVDERIELTRESVKDLNGARVETFDTLLVEYTKSRGGIAIIRGLRAVSDFEYELQMALMNRKLDADIETIFMMPSEEHTFLSSTIIKEVASFGGDVRGLVPDVVEKALREKFKKKHVSPPLA